MGGTIGDEGDLDLDGAISDEGDMEMGGTSGDEGDLGLGEASSNWRLLEYAIIQIITPASVDWAQLTLSCKSIGWTAVHALKVH